MDSKAYKMNILFLCVANSARSQLAEGIAKSLYGTQARIESAGSEPSGKVQPWAIKVLNESGIDISQNWSKSIDQLPTGFIEQLDFVITLCAEEVCPTILSKAKKIHWPIKDPAQVEEEQKAEAFRSARDEIKQKLEQFGRDVGIRN